MQDRVATYPGRVKLTPVAGQTNIYDMERADSPTVAGTPLNKQSLLTDATASAIAALGATSPSLPTEALSGLASVLDAMGVSNVCHIETGSYTGTGSHSSTTWLNIVFSLTPKFVIIFSPNGALGVPSNTTVLQWCEGQTLVGTTSPNEARVEFNLNGKTLQRRLKNAYIGDSVLMDTSGTTYYYVGVGTK